MFDSKNIKDYIAKAVVFKEELPKLATLKDKFARFTYLFPSPDDKMVCKAIFDTMFVSDAKARKFVSQMVDGVNTMFPQKISEMIDVYNDASVHVFNMLKEENKKASDADGERNVAETKQGSDKDDNKHGRAADPFIVMNASDPNREYKGGEIVSKKGKAVVSTISKAELEAVHVENNSIEEATRKKQEELAREEAKKRAAYEKTLAERRQKAGYAKVASEIQRVYNSHD